MQRVQLCRGGSRLHSALPLRAPATRRVAAVRVRAADDGSKNGKSVATKGDKSGDKVEQLLMELKNAGLTQAKAQKLLSKWGEMGAKEPDQLRKLLVKRSLQPFKFLGVQTLLDTGASIGGFITGRTIGDLQPPFFGQPLFQILGYFFGCYYFLQVTIELSVLGACLYTAYRYGTNSSEVLAAVRQLAGPSSSGVSLIDKAQVAVNTVRVLQILDEIQGLLKDQYGDGARASTSTLKNLQAYLTLSHAKDKYGFKPEKYGLTETQAGNIASCFAMYDLNDDGKLEQAELGKLCASLGKQLQEEEVREALRVLDTSRNGFIEFEEFVAWWVSSHEQNQATIEKAASDKANTVAK